SDAGRHRQVLQVEWGRARLVKAEEGLAGGKPCRIERAAALPESAPGFASGGDAVVQSAWLGVSASSDSLAGLRASFSTLMAIDSIRIRLSLNSDIRITLK